MRIAYSRNVEQGFLHASTHNCKPRLECAFRAAVLVGSGKKTGYRLSSACRFPYVGSELNNLP
jgi:hypothetical protein